MRSLKILLTALASYLLFNAQSQNDSDTLLLGSFNESLKAGWVTEISQINSVSVWIQPQSVPEVLFFGENYVLICDSKRSYAYHKYECSGLQNCTHQIQKIRESEAVKIGRSPCKTCY